ncbi:MAG: OmpA family protein [Acidobacteriaceae bacterium]
MRRRRHAEEHVNHERWLVSYADFVTLLFAFFVVLFASAYRDNQAMVRLSSAIHNGFQTLGAFSGGTDQKPIAYFPAPGAPADRPPRPSDPKTVGAVGAGPSPVDLALLRRQLADAMGAELRNHEVEMRVTPEGFVISLHELGFFDSGQAALLPGAAEKIERIAKILSAHDLDLRVEGHSDNQPIHTAEFRSNWELSTARAMTVLLLLVNQAGYNPARISVSGYAQYRPIADDSTAEGRRKNRRVDLVVVGTAAPQAARP